jgi:hypothetical protein
MTYNFNVLQFFGKGTTFLGTNSQCKKEIINNKKGQRFAGRFSSGTVFTLYIAFRLGLPPRVGFLLSQMTVLTTRFRKVALRLGAAWLFSKTGYASTNR